MKLFCSLTAGILLLLQLSACTDNKLPVPGQLASGYQPLFSCSNLGQPREHSTYSIFDDAAAMWENSFAYHYGLAGDTSLPFRFGIYADQLAQYMESGPGDSAYYDGLKFYFGIEDSVGKCYDVPFKLCLIVVPYKGEADQSFVPPIGPCVKIDGAGVMQGIDSATAQKYIDAWNVHYDVEPDFMLPVSGYGFPRGRIWEQIDTAQLSNRTDTVYFLFGCHTISPDDQEYCTPHSSKLYGFAIVNIVLATRQKNGGMFTRSSDFARPCPRFCGQSFFSLYCE